MEKKIALFGSTGSIGQNTLDIIRKRHNKFKVEILTAQSNIELLASQALEFLPKYIVIGDKEKYPLLKEMLKSSSIEIFAGEEALLEIAKVKVDLTMIAIVGAAAIKPTIESIRSKNTIALANKECLVCAGSIITKLAQENEVKIIPVDSEHNGLFQIFDFDNIDRIKNVTLTASGGPFRNLSLAELSSVTKEQALKHPNWSMGNKITIDSATLVNKCLEVIEAFHLFPLKLEQIEILIHPESIIHAMVSFIDGSNLAQFSKPNMQIPISYSLYYPQRAMLEEFNNFNLAEISKLNFYSPDKEKFKSLKLLDKILADFTSNSSLIFNVANEEAVNAFLNDKISFVEIYQIIEQILDKISRKEIYSIDDIFDEIENVKRLTQEYIKNLR